MAHSIKPLTLVHKNGPRIQTTGPNREVGIIFLLTKFPIQGRAEEFYKGGGSGPKFFRGV